MIGYKKSEPVEQRLAIDQRPKVQPINELIEKILICFYYIYPM